MAKKKTTKPKAKTAPKTEMDKAIADIEKSRGENTVVGGDTIRGFRHVSTGSFLLDYALLGGLPEGNGTMIYGHESVSKTTMCYKLIAGHQRKYKDADMGQICVFVDLEGKYNAEWAEALGVDLSRLKVVRPGLGEDAVDIIEVMMSAKECGLLAMDSIAAINPKVILENSAIDPTVGRRASLVGLLCSKLQQVWIDEAKRGHHPTFLCTNQWREKIGVQFGDPRTLPGGRYQQFMVNTKFELKSKEIKGGRTELGAVTTKKTEIADGIERHLMNTLTFNLPKRKHGFSIWQGDMDMVMDDPQHPNGLKTGEFDDARVAATYAKRDGIITGGGGAFKIDGLDEKFRTLDDIVIFLYENPREYLILKQTIIAKHRESVGLPPVPKDNYLLDWI